MLMHGTSFIQAWMYINFLLNVLLLNYDSHAIKAEL